VSRWTLLIAAVLALIPGFASGLIGIAGGVILIPAFVYILGLKPLDAAGTTLAALFFPVGLLPSLATGKPAMSMCASLS
jgi:hypothetical protein